MARNVIEREISNARDRGAQVRAAGLAAATVRYDAKSRRILIELSNGALFGVPVGSLPDIAGATQEELGTVELIGDSIVHIESLDADYSVAGLVTNAVGRVAGAHALGRLGGVATSEAKAEAARRNGAKGGRPPKERGGGFVVNGGATDSVIHGRTGKIRDHSAGVHKPAASGRFTVKAGAKRAAKKK